MDSAWVFALFSGLAVAAVVAARLVHRRQVRDRRAEAAALVRRSFGQSAAPDAPSAGSAPSAGPAPSAAHEDDAAELPRQRERREHPTHEQ